MDVEELAHGPDAKEKRGGFRENHAIDGGEKLAHREPLERLLVCPLNAVELYVVSIRGLGVQLRVVDVKPFARQAHLQVEEIRRLEIAFLGVGSARVMSVVSHLDAAVEVREARESDGGDDVAVRVNLAGRHLELSGGHRGDGVLCARPSARVCRHAIPRKIVIVASAVPR